MTHHRLTGLATPVALLCLSALPLLLLGPLFEAPFERDQGAFATIARGWMEGAIPYRDAWDNKGPVLFLWYVAAFAWLGETLVAPRVMAAIAAGVSVPFIWGAAKALFGPRVAMLAAALFALSFVNIYLQFTANSEVFMLLPLSAGLWAFSRGATGGRSEWFFAAGVLTGLAILTRQSAIMALLGYAVWLGVIWWRIPQERRRQAVAVLLLIVGALLPFVPFVAYFAVNDGLSQFWHAMFGFNIEWSLSRPFYMKLVPPMLLNPAPLLGGLFFWALAGIGAWRLWKRNDRLGWLVVSWLVFAELAAQTIGRESPHYSVQLLPGAALVAAIGASYVADRWAAGSRRPAAVIAGTAIVTLVAVLFAYARPSAEDRFVVQYTFRDYAQDAVKGGAVAAEVERMTDPDDCVYEWGRSSQIFFLANRQPCSEWMHNRPYDVNDDMVPEVMADLEEKRPPLIVVTSNDPAMPPELAAHLERHYRHVGQVEYAQLYWRIGAHAAAASSALTSRRDVDTPRRP